MAMSNKAQLDILITEIDNLVTLLVKVDEGREPMDTLTEQKQKVLDLLPVTPDDGPCRWLQNLCIQKTRTSMRDFSNESFMSLPVPNMLRWLIMYQHVAEIACEALSCQY